MSGALMMVDMRASTLSTVPQNGSAFPEPPSPHNTTLRVFSNTGADQPSRCSLPPPNAAAGVGDVITSGSTIGWLERILAVPEVFRLTSILEKCTSPPSFGLDDHTATRPSWSWVTLKGISTLKGPRLPNSTWMVVDFMPTERPFSPVTFAIRFCSKVESASPLILTGEIILEFNPGDRIRMASGAWGMLDLVAVGAGVGNLVGTPVRALVGMAVGGMV